MIRSYTVIFTVPGQRGGVLHARKFVWECSGTPKSSPITVIGNGPVKCSTKSTSPRGAIVSSRESVICWTRGRLIRDLFGGLGPDEWSWILVPVGDPRADVGFEGLHRLVGAAADLLVGEESEPAFDLVDPGGSGGGEVHVEAGVSLEPGPDGGGFVGALVVADQVYVEAGWDGLVDGDQELLELDRAVLTVQFADDRAVGGVERGEQAGDAVAVVVMGAAFGHAGHHRQDRLGAFQGLDLGLFVHTQHHRPFGRVVIQPDDVDDFLDELRVGRQFERVRPVRLEAEVALDPADR